MLKLAGVGGLFLLGGTWVWRTLRGFGPPAKGLLVFDTMEFAVVESLCEAKFPGPPEWPYSAAEIKVPQFVDLYVAELYEDTQQLFRMLIRTLALSTVVSHGRSFNFLPVKARQEVLREWATSDLRVRRAGYQSLSFATHMGYFEDARVRAAAGFTSGCEVAAAASPMRPDLWAMRSRHPEGK